MLNLILQGLEQKSNLQYVSKIRSTMLRAEPASDDRSVAARIKGLVLRLLLSDWARALLGFNGLYDSYSYGTEGGHEPPDWELKYIIIVFQQKSSN
jgi:hypothetical protein